MPPDTRDADGDGEASGEGAVLAGTERADLDLKRAQVIAARITSVADGDTWARSRTRAGRRLLPPGAGRGREGARSRCRDFHTVRLIGIDTPETKDPGKPVECGGKRATAAMLRLSFTAPEDANGDGLEDQAGGDGRRVTLTTDPTQDTFDRYGRLLAYVTTRSGVHLQTQQLSRGWGKVYVFRDPFLRVGRYRAAERRARKGRRGVWRRCGGNFHTPA